MFLILCLVLCFACVLTCIGDPGFVLVYVCGGSTDIEYVCQYPLWLLLHNRG